ncbi:MAG: PEP-CTERM sorting domain-containing protein [Verrucomicrobiales bacterium]
MDQNFTVGGYNQFADINGDGTTDVIFNADTITLQASGANGAEIVAGGPRSSALEHEFPIGPELIGERQWFDRVGINACTGYEPCFGPWVGEDGSGFNAFLGVRFRADDAATDWNYGWINLDTTFFPFPDFGQVRGWAYETEPGVGIRAGVVPEPSVALLTFSAMFVGLLVRRRRQFCKISFSDP